LVQFGKTHKPTGSSQMAGDGHWGSAVHGRASHVSVVVEQRSLAGQSPSSSHPVTSG
jgi:hypothetical protein